MLSPRLDALPAVQRSLWPFLALTPRHFTLYGGTAVALRLGHRESVDFDWFSDVPLNDESKNELITQLGRLGAVSVLQNDRNTLTLSLSREVGPVKLSFFGGMSHGRVGEPDATDDGVTCVASMDDLFAHKLKVIHDRAEGKDYQDIAVMLASGCDLARGLACVEALFGSNVPPMVTLKALTYFDDVNEAWRVTDAMKAAITTAVAALPERWEKATAVSRSLGCAAARDRS
jgi:hypothetical protein